MKAKERDFGWSKVKVSGLHLLWYDVKSVEGRKEERWKKLKGKAIRPLRAEERDFGWSKVKVSGLHVLWFDVKSVEGRDRKSVV